LALASYLDVTKGIVLSLQEEILVHRNILNELRIKHLSYGKWPASGEIDIMESRGNDKIWNPRDNEDAGNNCFGSTLHWGPYFPANGFPKTHESVCLTNGRSFADEWHTYTLDWTTEYIAFELDGEEFFRVPKPQGGFWQFGEFEKDFPGSENPWTEGNESSISRLR